ncbi:MAG: putative toxin-antitoxin system toxin component, PIN family [Acidobacteria bacterium]|nr:putative toxin-antitoxin system toxin component, PIN family [Acidobacteriota bacterium]
MSAQEKYRAVFDCNVLVVAAARDKSHARACLRLAEFGYIELFVSRASLEELEDVLNRPGLRKFFPTLTDEVVQAFLIRLRETARFVRKVPKRFSYARDVDDEQYVDLAAAVDAHFIISRDKDLLSLNKGHTTECKEFRQRFRPLRVIEPLDFLREVAAVRNLSVAELRTELEQH